MGDSLAIVTSIYADAVRNVLLLDYFLRKPVEYLFPLYIFLGLVGRGGAWNFLYLDTYFILLRFAGVLCTYLNYFFYVFYVSDF